MPSRRDLLATAAAFGATAALPRIAGAATPPELIAWLKTAGRLAIVYAGAPLAPADERRLRLAVFSGHARLARTP